MYICINRIEYEKKEIYVSSIVSCLIPSVWSSLCPTLCPTLGHISNDVPQMPHFGAHFAIFSILIPKKILIQTEWFLDANCRWSLIYDFRGVGRGRGQRGWFLAFGTRIFGFLVSNLLSVAIFEFIGPISIFLSPSIFDPPPAERVDFWRSRPWFLDFSHNFCYP